MRAQLLLHRQQLVGVVATGMVLLGFSGYFIFRGAWIAIALLVFSVAGIIVSVYAQRAGNAALVSVRHPALAALAGDVATTLGVPAPDLVELAGDTDIALVPRGRQILLRIGLPLVLSLNASELRVLIAHELAMLGLTEPRLTIALATARRHVADQAGMPGRDGHRLVAATGEFAASVERAADEAALKVADPVTVAAAVLHADAVRLVFSGFVLDFGEPPTEHGQAVLDLGEGWSWWLANGPADDRTGLAYPTELVRRHPGLSAIFPHSAVQEVELCAPADPIKLDPFTDEERRRLVTEAVYITGPVNWVRLSEVDGSVWAEEAQERVRAIERAAEEAVGRAPGDRAELADVARDRIAELQRVLLRHIQTDLDPAAQPGTPTDEVTVDPSGTLTRLLVASLHERGWRRAHPLLPNLLIGPGGQRVDAAQLGRSAANGQDSYQELRDLLV